MDEINPYATPRSTLRSDSAAPAGKPRGYGWYKRFSLAYGLLAMVVCLLFVSEQARASPLWGVIPLVLLAPLISYLLVANRLRRLSYSWLPLHLIGVCLLFGLFVDRDDPQDRVKATVFLFLATASLLSWLSSLYFHWRLGKK